MRSGNDKWPTGWSPDGGYLIYQELDPKTNWNLWALPLSGDRKSIALVATPSIESQGQMSPDGRWLAYTSDETGPAEIYIQRFPPSAGKWQISSGGGAQPRWRRDGRELYYLTRTTGELMAAEIQTLTSTNSATIKAGVPRSRFPANANSSFGLLRNAYDVSSDGQKFLINTTPPDSSANGTDPITVVLNWTAGLGK